MMDFREYFPVLTALEHPHSWQQDLAADRECSNRLIRIPTGFGKTLGVLAAWSYHRVRNCSEAWPRRLIWCLPMRVLVEQTVAEVEAALERIGVLWDKKSDHEGKVGVHRLMGGSDAGEWQLHPEQCAVLIGTQDMLLSRAMNRGYAAPRARWPMEFGLLNQDCLWVMDEVQLMDVGLATSAQLQAFREGDGDDGRNLRPCRSWWMSATLQPGWLEKSPDTQAMAASLSQTTIPAEMRTGHLWQDVQKPCQIVSMENERQLADLAAQRHADSGRGANGPTLVVVNTVDRAVKVFDALGKNRIVKGADLRLVHSRYRPHERAPWREGFLNRNACASGTDRIIVSTQVIEAGVDLSAGVLITELAPWPSLVQRFGRAARWGGEAQIVIVDFNPADDKKAAPYSKGELDAAREALTLLQDVAPLHLEAFEERHAELLARLYPFEPKHLLLRHEVDELFDTTPDLSGADIDISRFIRSGDERDLHVFWADIADRVTPDPELKPSREALCAVPFLKARDWLCKEKSERLREKKRAWVWDWLDGAWRRAERRDLYPGQTVLVAASCGGYDPKQGWSPDSPEPVTPVASALPDAAEQSDAAQDDETLSAYPWQTIAVHGREVGTTARRIAERVAPELGDLFDLAGRWHDAGKVHVAFNNSIVHADRPVRRDLAKAPKHAWLPPRKLYPIEDGERRRGFRHELASTLALFAVLQQHEPDHEALLGPWRELLDKAGMAMDSSPPEGGAANPLEREILALGARQFDLLAYLVCAHHGKVRLAWHACPADQQAADERLRIRGVRDGDRLPQLILAAQDHTFHELPEATLDLSPAAAGLNAHTGRGWTERVLSLLDHRGPFALAYLEAILRAADQRASRTSVVDPLLEADNEAHGLERSDSNLARIASGRTQAASPAGDTAPRRPLHGDGGGTRGRELHPGTTLPPHSATRYLETELGTLSYQQLAPHLAERVGLAEVAISERQFALRRIDEALILDLHHRICGDLVPTIAGRWRTREVQVGDHRAPPVWQVPMLMRDYAADLAARVAHVSASADELLIETLTFAEGQLLHIHPFEDFNGRVTRLFVIELLYRLHLPIVDPATDEGEETARYFAALRAYDKRDSDPLAVIWRERFEKEALE